MPDDRKIKFYREMFEVQVSYLHHRLRREPWWGMDYGIRNFTMIYAIATNAPGVRMDLDELSWRKILADCWYALMCNQATDERELFVKFLWDTFGARWLNAYPVFESHAIERKDYFGCFRYDYHADTKIIHLHFANTEEPHSPFEHPERRKADLRAIVADIENKKLQPVRAHFDSWMNALKPVASLFPASHAQSLAAAEEFPKGYGWWGQFIQKDGSLNQRRAEAMKRSGQFELARLNGSSPWTDFKLNVEQ
jgi:hypothetical protein